MGMLNDIGNAGTFRSDYYRRKIPYVGPDVYYDEDQLQKVLERAEQASQELKDNLNPLKNVPGLGLLVSPFTDASQDRKIAKKQLLEQNPWLWQVLEEVVDARLRMMTSDEPWAKDKKYGWKMEASSKAPPESPYFRYAVDEETGLPYVDDTELALDLIEKTPQWYESERNKFSDYLTHPYNFSLTPAERNPEGDDSWYETTNDFLDALLATKLKESDRQALYDAAQYIWDNRMLNEQKKFKDALNAERPLGGEGLGAMTDGDEQQFFDTQYGKFFDEKGKPVRMFSPRSMLASAVGDMIAPSISSVWFDPELYYKTSPEEMALRGANDFGQLAISELLPWIGAIKGMRMLRKPLVGAMTGGAVGGMADYGVKRAANEAFDERYGHGTDTQPFNIWDLGEYGILGALTGPLIGTGRLKGQQELRKAMNPMAPESVTGDDIKASFQTAKEYGPTKKGKALNNEFRTAGKTGFDEYERNYPRDVREVETAPVPKAGGLPLATGLVGRDPKSYRIPTYSDFYERLYGKSATHGVRGQYENKNKIMDPNKTEVAPLAKTNAKGKPLKSELTYNEPVAWAEPDDEFVAKYLKENPNYWNADFTLEDRAGLGAILGEAQKKGSPVNDFFTGRRIVVTGDDFKKKQAMLSGNTVMDEKAKGSDVLARMWNAKSKPVPTARRDKTIFGKTIPVVGKGKVDPVRQQKEFETAKKTYARRANQNVVSKDQYKAWTKGMYPIRRGLGLTVPVMNNMVPFGSNTLMGVNPIEYEE